jgi:hypothetical protein
MPNSIFPTREGSLTILTLNKPETRNPFPEHNSLINARLAAKNLFINGVEIYA